MSQCDTGVPEREVRVVPQNTCPSVLQRDEHAGLMHNSKFIAAMNMQRFTPVQRHARLVGTRLLNNELRRLGWV